MAKLSNKLRISCLNFMELNTLKLLKTNFKQYQIFNLGNDELIEESGFKIINYKLLALCYG